MDDKKNDAQVLRIRTNEESFVFHIYHIARLFYGGKIEVDLSFPPGIPADFEVLRSDHEDTVRILAGEGESVYPGRDKESCKRAVFQYLQSLNGMKVPWGTLVGVRPTKIAAELLKKGKNPDEAEAYYRNTYFVSPEKARLAVRVAQKETEILSSFPEDEIGVYFDMPFCPSRCSYCSFLSYPSSDRDLMARYHKAFLRDIQRTGKMLRDLGMTPGYLYFGGGTPTSPEISQFREIMEAIRSEFVLGGRLTEFTVEAGRPDTITEEKLSVMRDAGVTRISINPQTFSDHTLRTLCRTHTADDIESCFHMARNAGFHNINMDFIFGLPGETETDVVRSMERACLLRPENITIHGLALKKGSRLAQEGVRSAERIVGMYDAAYAILEQEGYEPYYLYRNKNTLGNMENLGFTLPGFASRYNMAMIEETDTIVAVGASGVTRVVTGEVNEQGRGILERHMAFKDVQLYLSGLDESLLIKKEILSHAKEAKNRI